MAGLLETVNPTQGAGLLARSGSAPINWNAFNFQTPPPPPNIRQKGAGLLSGINLSTTAPTPPPPPNIPGLDTPMWSGSFLPTQNNPQVEGLGAPLPQPNIIQKGAGLLSGIGSSIVSTFTNPSPYEQSIEQGLPSFERPFARAFSPITNAIHPAMSDIAAGIVNSVPALSSQFEKLASQGAFSGQTQQAGAAQDILASMGKSPRQVIGDTAQAVLSLYSPSVFGKGLSTFASRSFAKAATVTATHGAELGLKFGIAQAMSSGSNDPKEIANIVAQNTIGMALFNVAGAAVAHGLASSVGDVLDSIKNMTPEERQAGFAHNPFAGEGDVPEGASGLPAEAPVRPETAPTEPITPTYYHSTSADAAKSIEQNGFTAQIGERSLGVANAKGVWLYEDKGATTEFGKNFTRAGKTPAVVETKVSGKIFDATNEDRSIRAVVEDKTLMAKLRADGYVGVKGDELGTSATFVFDTKALKVAPKVDPLTQEAQKYSSAEEFVKAQVDKKYPIAGDSVSGLKVRDGISNQDSIGASFNSSVTLSDVREVPMSEFGKPDVPTAKVRALADAIQASGEIEPLIVAIGKDGPYILEGGHRFDALGLLGKKSIPAQVVIDNGSMSKSQLTDIWNKAHGTSNLPENMPGSSAPTTGERPTPPPISETGISPLESPSDGTVRGSGSGISPSESGGQQPSRQSIQARPVAAQASSGQSSPNATTAAKLIPLNEAHPAVTPDVHAAAGDLHAAAAEAQSSFQTSLDKIAQNNGWQIDHGPIKTHFAIGKKASIDYAGDVSKVGDANRSTLVIHDPAEFDKAITAVQKEFGTATRPIKNGFSDNPTGSFKSINLKVRTSAGHEAEIQITTPEMYHAKTTLGGHNAYKAGDQSFQREVYGWAHSATASRLASASDNALRYPDSTAERIGTEWPVKTDVAENVPSGALSTRTKVSDVSKNLGNFPSDHIQSNLPRKGGTGNGTNPAINPEHLNIDPQAKALLTSLSNDLAPKTAEKIGAPMTNQEVIDFAKANPNLTQNAVSREASLKASAAMLQARQTLAAQMEALQRGGVAPADKADIIRTFLAVKTTATDLGRSLQKLSVNAEPTEGSTAADIIAKIAKTGASVDDIIAAAQNVDFNDYHQVVDFYRKFVQPKAGDWLDLVRYNSMLSSPLTLSNIFAGNLFNIAAQPIVKTAAGAIDWLKTGIFGGTQTHFIGEGLVYGVGATKNIGTAVRNFTDVLQDKLDPKMLDFNIPLAGSESAKLKLGGNFGLPSKTVRVPANVVKGLNIFTTLHKAVYQLFNTIAKGGTEAALAYKAARGVVTPFPDMVAQAEADYATLRAGSKPKGQGDLLNGIDMIKDMVTRIANQDIPSKGTLAANGGSLIAKWTAKFTLPFVRLSTNMAKQMVEYSPAGFFTMFHSDDQITQFTKASLGTAAFAGIGLMAASGNITGAAPTVPADKTAFAASGRQAYSIKIGNTWISYNKLPPAFSIPMLLAASYVQSQATGKNVGKMQSVLDSAGSFGKYFADQSYVKNIGQFLSAVQGDTTKGNPVETLITNDVQQLMPFRAFSGWLAKLLDPNQRQIDSSKGAIQKQVQLFMEQIPVLREQVPAKTDAVGNPIANPNHIINAFSPFQTSPSTPKQEQGFQDYNTEKQLQSDATKQSKALSTQATTEFQHIQSLPDPASKKQYLMKLANTNPDLVKKVIDLMKKPQGLTPSEKKLVAMSTIPRAQFLASQRSTYATPAAYKAYLLDLASKKILTTDTLTALAKLLNNK